MIFYTGMVHWENVLVEPTAEVVVVAQEVLESLLNL